jgi:hypothetical protein
MMFRISLPGVSGQIGAARISGCNFYTAFSSGSRWNRCGVIRIPYIHLW